MEKRNLTYRDCVIFEEWNKLDGVAKRVCWKPLLIDYRIELSLLHMLNYILVNIIAKYYHIGKFVFRRVST